LIVTDAPVLPEEGDKLVIAGAGRTVNGDPLLTPAPVWTTTLPVVAPAGTIAIIDVPLNMLIVAAATPLNFTMLPKLNSVPVIVTAAPIAAEDGDRLVIVGVTGQLDSVNAKETEGFVILSIPKASVPFKLKQIFAPQPCTLSPVLT
jgi:hypothetical protein